MILSSPNLNTCVKVILQSDRLGDVYQDPHNRYKSATKRPKTAKPFRSGYTGSKVKHAEFEYMPVNK